MTKITKKDIGHLQKLANLQLSAKESRELTGKVAVTVEYVSKLKSLKTDNVKETSQVTGTVNVFREDKIDTSRMFTQKEALANAKRIHNGFFVVDGILND